MEFFLMVDFSEDRGRERDNYSVAKIVPIKNRGDGVFRLLIRNVNYGPGCHLFTGCLFLLYMGEVKCKCLISFRLMRHCIHILRKML
jgi:hypothetical protein